MPSIIIRLDDACPTMNHDNWDRVEGIFDKYGVKPLVGIIPDNRDRLFAWESDPDFWGVTARRWEDKGWCIAQHGCYHLYQSEDGSPSDEAKPGERTEFKGLPRERQRELIDTGYAAMSAHGIEPKGFFAPNHTFDDTTIDILRESGRYGFISDGPSFDLFRYRGMAFIPYIPASRKFPIKPRVSTRVLHPNTMGGGDIDELEAWLKDSHGLVASVPEIMSRQGGIKNKARLSGAFSLYLALVRTAAGLYNRLKAQGAKRG
ncbi:MAG: DUF2334 domain-containing protein [Clostridiales Family XIII bacterium]|jgi:hypothetical protein|nr:DUF2334 domain-containing protein [Clostridiales Family XIII bacterium]